MANQLPTSNIEGIIIAITGLVTAILGGIPAIYLALKAPNKRQQEQTEPSSDTRDKEIEELKAMIKELAESKKNEA